MGIFRVLGATYRGFLGFTGGPIGECIGLSIGGPIIEEYTRTLAQGSFSTTRVSGIFPCGHS